MNSVWVRCFIMPGILKEESTYRIYKSNGIALEGVSPRKFIAPTHSAHIGGKSKEQLQKEMEARKAVRAENRKARAELRAKGIKPSWPAKVKRAEDTGELYLWGAITAQLLNESEGRATISLPDGQVAEVNSIRILSREQEQASA
jgi:hypothetical protein